MKTKAALATALLLTASATGSLVKTPLAQAIADLERDGEDSMPLDKGTARMVIVEDMDVSGQVFKRLGLPNQNYCWEQCLQEARCAATRWGAIEGATAGQCQLLSGELTFGEPREIKTGDGQRIVVIVSRKETGAAEPESARAEQ
jgi:hypothetical protein